MLTEPDTTEVDQKPVGATTMSRTGKFLLPFVALIAVAALAVGVFALASKPKISPLKRDLNTLQARLTSVRSQLSLGSPRHGRSSVRE